RRPRALSVQHRSAFDPRARPAADAAAALDQVRRELEPEHARGTVVHAAALASPSRCGARRGDRERPLARAARPHPSASEPLPDRRRAARRRAGRCVQAPGLARPPSLRGTHRACEGVRPGGGRRRGTLAEGDRRAPRSRRRRAGPRGAFDANRRRGSLVARSHARVGRPAVVERFVPRGPHPPFSFRVERGLAKGFERGHGVWCGSGGEHGEQHSAVPRDLPRRAGARPARPPGIHRSDRRVRPGSRPVGTGVGARHGGGRGIQLRELPGGGARTARSGGGMSTEVLVRPAPVARRAPAVALPGIGKHDWIFQLGFIAAHIPLGILVPKYSSAITWHARLAFILAALVAMTTRRWERVACAAAYITGAEVYWRMRHARVPWEFGKYAIIV